ncbi:prolyl oligopeptidase family serine peptidase [Paenibacillus sp. LMG 31456]|uniref:Prolyl oligopeptidase family serine peptidase n=1 Tax=Paenibacillus foliorum TaxID=2654974 RepID=A0A972H6I7_9BACL|nr:prolyl oligopeptidase family serine peptidase [Paenibacillus foliorum]NOU97261.1 prolyl oligopeptidase family serine peptidase [Paenibacillus foliorum]
MKQKLSMFISMFFVCTILTLSIHAYAETAPKSFSDVKENHYASKEISKLAQLGIIEGGSDGLFHPDSEITRGMTALWLSKALKLKEPVSLKGFIDIPESSTYSLAVNALKENGIVQGDEGRFNPEALLTREQMASLLVRAFKLKENGVNVWFKDESLIGESHYKDVVRLKQHLITDQLEYLPKNQVTRAQLVLFLSRAISQGETGKDEIPLSDFLRKSKTKGIQTSPDGKFTAYLEEFEGHLQIYVEQDGVELDARLTNMKDRDIEDFYWFNNDRILYISSVHGLEDYHVHSVDPQGKEDKDLTPYDNIRADIMESLSYLPGHENDVLLSINNRDRTVFDVQRLNVKTGKMDLVAENPGNITSWLTDVYGEARLAVAKDGVNSKVLYRSAGQSKFEPILDVNFGDTFKPIMFSFDESQVFALSDIGRNTMALVKYNLNTKTMGETVYENPDADVTNIVISYKKQAILAVKYETDKVHYHFLDKEFEQLHQAIAKKLPGQQFVITGNPLPETNVNLFAYSDRSSGVYYQYNRKTDSIKKVKDTLSWIKEDQLAEMKPISYGARDGLTINGYLTLPRNAGDKNLPFVILPHGGPWVRDSWGYDREVQILANRGYGVLQMNFRGSTGYGKTLFNAGNKQWGQAMQNDITDGVNWLIKEGTADPKRIAIYGASYGGYAALAGMTFTPELYAAGIDYMGPSSLLTFLNTMPPYWDKKKMYRQVGDPELDKQMMEAYSPLLHVDRIKAPIMFAQGVNDPRVNRKESDQMVMAIRQRGIDAPYMIKENEGHGFRNYDNQMDFYTTLLKFLDTHLKK